MAIDGVSSYLTTNSSTSAKKTNGSSLTMDDFLALLVAQLSNQDMNNTTDNTEFVAQMAQFSMVQAIAELSEQSMTAYSVSLIGKNATVSTKDSNGKMGTVTGVVQGVTIDNGNTNIVIDGESYSMDSVLEVYDASLLTK